LEIGINIKFNDIERDTKFFVISGIYDKPAKAAVLNMVTSTGFYGCTKCLQPGESYKTKLNGNLI
jgi:hypothetical protein